MLCWIFTVSPKQHTNWLCQGLFFPLLCRCRHTFLAKFADITLCRRNVADMLVTYYAKHRKALTGEVVLYIRHHLDLTSDDPFGYFYLLVKLQKTPLSTRPVCSDCASVPHALGKWLDIQLQPILLSVKENT